MAYLKKYDELSTLEKIRFRANNVMRAIRSVIVYL